MKLQIALDGDLSSSTAVLKAVRPYVDIAEIGTPLIYREGMAAVLHFRHLFPDLPLLADLKIMDAGEDEAAIAFEAGCALVTVLGVTQDVTVRGAVAAARRYRGRVMADMMQVPDMLTRARELLAMGCDYLCVHTAHDLQDAHTGPLDALRRLRQELPDAPLAVAGGIRLETVAAVAALNPAIVIVGSAITLADDPADAARRLRERMNGT